MKRYFLPQAKFLQQLPTKKEIEEALEAPVQNVVQNTVEVVTNEFGEVKETSKKNKKNKNKKKNK